MREDGDHRALLFRLFTPQRHCFSRPFNPGLPFPPALSLLTSQKPLSSVKIRKSDLPNVTSDITDELMV